MLLNPKFVIVKSMSEERHGLDPGGFNVPGQIEVPQGNVLLRHYNAIDSLGLGSRSAVSPLGPACR